MFEVSWGGCRRCIGPTEAEVIASSRVPLKGDRQVTSVAKILGFIVAVAAIAFAAASFVMVSNTTDYRTRWTDEKAEHAKTKSAWAEDKADLTQQLQQAKEAQDEAERQQKAKQDELAGLEVRYKNLEVRCNSSEKRNQELTAAVNKINDTLSRQAQEIATLRKEKEDQRLACEAAIRAKEKAEDNLTSCQEDLSIERQKNAQLTKNLDVATGRVSAYIEAAPEVVVHADRPEMPDVGGKVLRVDNTKGIVLVSVGSDDGVQENFSFEVFRPGQYVGRVWVMEVYEERAICRIDSTMTKTLIMENDPVSTRLP